MKSKALAFIRSNRTIKTLLMVLGTIFLGALGSGLWELMLRDLLVSLGNITLSLISSVWGGYVDLLHDDIGKLRSDTLSVPVFAFVLTFVLFAPWILVGSLLKRIKRLRDKLTGSEQEISPKRPEELLREIDSLRKRVFQILVPVLFFSTGLYAVEAWQIVYSRRAGSWAERSIEIVRPHITEKKYITLRAELRAIDNAASFYALEANLKQMADEASVQLPDFVAIRRINNNQ